MTDSMDESMTTAKTFRFASGQILTLEEDQIEKIPYLAALISSADFLESARDEDGHYKLDQYIEYKYFSFVLESLSFHSVRQLFIRLPKKNDVIPIIALLDFLGLGPQPNPTLNEVDSIFFSTLVYSPMLEKHVQIVRPTVIQDMAIRLAIAMIKEEYDFTKPKVIDQIYWFITFILSAYELFGPRLRYHVYTIAENCFSLFKPSLLKPLRKLISKTEKYIGQRILIKNKEDVDPDDENKRPLEQLFDPSYHLDWSYRILFLSATLEQRQELLLNRTYRDYSQFWDWRAPNEKDLLEPVYRRVLEIMYERLQNDICQRAIAEIRGKNSVHKSEQEQFDSMLSFILFQPCDLPKRISDIFISELVQEEIRERILEEICVLAPKLEQRRVELVKKIAEYEQHSETSNENRLYGFHFMLYGVTSYETMQEEALSHELLLDKLQHGSTIVEQIYRRVLDALYSVTRNQFNQWKRTQHYIDVLYHYLSIQHSREKSPSNTSKIMHKHHRMPVNKPLPKRQLKYSKR